MIIVGYVRFRLKLILESKAILLQKLHPRQVPRLRAANVLLTRRTKPAQHGENQNPSVSFAISKVTLDQRFHVGYYKRQINKVSLLFSFGENKEPKSLNYLAATKSFRLQKRSKERLLQKNQRTGPSVIQHCRKTSRHALEENRLVIQTLRHFGQ